MEFRSNRIAVDHRGGMTGLAQISHPTTIPFVMTVGGLLKHRVPMELTVPGEGKAREVSQHGRGGGAPAARGFNINKVSPGVIGNPVW